MSSQVRIVKKQTAAEAVPTQVSDVVKNESQRNREIVGVIKSWIDEFKLRSKQESRVTLPLLNKA